MTDYAQHDVDSLRAIAQYCGGTEYGIFLDGLADRMEAVVVEPVFTRGDVAWLREMGEHSPKEGWCEDDVAMYSSLADRIERTLPAEASE